MGLGDLTLLLIGRDAVAEQLCAHLEQRGADIERAPKGEALDTIAVAVPDLVIVSADAAKTDAERIRDGLRVQAKPPRLLVLCERTLAARLGVNRYGFVGTLEPDLGAEALASCIEALCELLGTEPPATPLRTLVARVHKPKAPPRVAVPEGASLKPLRAASLAAAPRKTLQMPGMAALPVATAEPAAVANPAAVAKSAPSPIAHASLRAAPVAHKHLAAPLPIAALSAAPATAPVARSFSPSRAPVAAASAPVAVAEIAVEIDSIAPAVPVPAPVSVSLATPAQLPLPVATPAPLPVAMPAPLPAPVPVPVPSFARRATSALAPRLRDAASFAAALLVRASAWPRRVRLTAAALAVLCIVTAGALAASTGGGARASLAPGAAASLHAISRAETAASPEPAAHAPATLSASAATPDASARVSVPDSVATHVRSHTSHANEADDTELGDERPGIDLVRARANRFVNDGHRLRKEGRWGMAEASYLKALEVMPSYARAVAGVVQVHLGRRDSVEALRWAQKLVALQPTRGAHQRLLGDAYALSGQRGLAEAAWRTASRYGDREARSRLP